MNQMTQLLNIVIIVAIYVLISIVFFCINYQLKNCFTMAENFSFSSLFFLSAFWMTYFMSDPFNITTLRNFLDNKSYRHLTEEEERDDKTLDDKSSKEISSEIAQKSLTAITSSGTLMAVVSLFLVLVDADKNTGLYYRLLKVYFIFPSASIILILTLWSIDIFDTVYNKFRGTGKDDLKLRIAFYRKIGGIGNNWLSGGVSYRFLSIAFLSIFIFSSLGIFSPVLSGLSICLYCYLGYSFLYGYKREGDSYEIDYDNSSCFSLLLLIINISILLLTIWILSKLC